MSEAVAEFIPEAVLADAAPQWADLCARAAEPNPFADPCFLLPLLDYERPRNLRFAVVREGERWIGFAALTMPPIGLARIWMSPYAALPAFVFDGEAGPAALAKLLGDSTRLAGVVWPFVETGGPLSAALRGSGLPLLPAGQRRRAALRLAGAAAFDASLNPKRRTKWGQQGRRLARAGKLETVPDTEAFFEVERKGWKGQRGTALADDPSRLAFAREALAAFERAGRLDALSMRLDDKPIAAGLVLIAADRAFYWKTAYDEAHADTSPGVQLTLAHSRRLAETPGLKLVDSCAAEDHPMIGRVWGDVLLFEDWALALRPGTERALAIWLRFALAKAEARQQVKRLVLRALGRT